MKLFIILIIILLILGLVTYKLVKPCLKQAYSKAKAVIQYTNPIGPTKTPPYSLNSSILKEFDHERL